MPGQELPDALAHIQSGSPRSSRTQEEIETISITTEPPTPGSEGANEPTTGNTPITTDLRNYEVVDDEYALEQKVSYVSTHFQLLTVYQC